MAVKWLLLLLGCITHTVCRFGLFLHDVFVCVWVWHTVSCAEMAEPIEMPFGGRLVCQRNLILEQSPDFSRKGQV